MRKILDLTTVSIALAVVAFWGIIVVISGTGINLFPSSWDFENTGQFGDSFGSLSAIMASLAALSALATFKAQQAEIQRLKKREVAQASEQRAEMRRVRRRETHEDKRIRKAEFERTFFQLVATFNSIVSETDFVNQSQQHPKKGRDAFKAILDVFDHYRNTKSDSDAYTRTVERFPNDLNHYFRFLYHVVNFVNRQDEIDRYFYVRLVRALLSDAEITLLALNCTYGEGEEKFKPLVEEYALLHNISGKYRAILNLDGHFAARAFDR